MRIGRIEDVTPVPTDSTRRKVGSYSIDLNYLYLFASHRVVAVVVVYRRSLHVALKMLCDSRIVSFIVSFMSLEFIVAALDTQHVLLRACPVVVPVSHLSRLYRCGRYIRTRVSSRL
jgi:hypothetical protein